MNFKQLLKKHNLSLTECRLQLMKILSEAESPLPEKDIEKIMTINVNRTTIYRNLNALSETGIIQRVLSGDSIKYKLNLPLNRGRGISDHIHFQCTICNEVICMKNLKVKDYILPEGYNKIENQFLIIGICRQCNES